METIFADTVQMVIDAASDQNNPGRAKEAIEKLKSWLYLVDLCAIEMPIEVQVSVRNMVNISS